MELYTVQWRIWKVTLGGGEAPIAEGASVEARSAEVEREGSGVWGGGIPLPTGEGVWGGG